MILANQTSGAFVASSNSNVFVKGAITHSRSGRFILNCCVEAHVQQFGDGGKLCALIACQLIHSALKECSGSAALYQWMHCYRVRFPNKIAMSSIQFVNAAGRVTTLLLAGAQTKSETAGCVGGRKFVVKCAAYAID